MLCIMQVVSIGQGREGESGTLIENAGLNPGDLVYVKDPWGELRLLLIPAIISGACIFCKESLRTELDAAALYHAMLLLSACACGLCGGAFLRTACSHAAQQQQQLLHWQSLHTLQRHQTDSYTSQCTICMQALAPRMTSSPTRSSLLCATRASAQSFLTALSLKLRHELQEMKLSL
jgi:hypothetical protein